MIRQFRLTLLGMGFLALGFAPSQPWIPCDQALLTAQMAKFDALMAKQTRCKLTTELVSYRRSTDVVPSDHAFSTVWRHGKRFKAEQLGLMSYQNDSLCAAVDEEDKKVVISEPRGTQENLLSDRVKGLLYEVSSIACQDINGGKLFRVEYARNSPNAHMDITYETDGWMSEVVLQLRSGNYTGGEGPLTSIDDPNVVFRFQRPGPLEGKAAEGIGQGPLAFIRSGTHGLVLTGKWSGYRLIDTRYRP